MTRRIDHLVLAVRDLDAAARFYETLGFQVGVRNRHPWGTENRLIQFGSSFLELVTVGDGAQIPPHAPGIFSFGAFVRDYLSKREGLAMFVLDSNDARADAMAFANARIGAFEPFFFERKGTCPDGSEIRVAFTLAFAMDYGLPDTSFFVCQQHFPEAFWNPVFQNHANGTLNVTGVTLGVDTPADHVGFLKNFTGETCESGVKFSLAHDGEIGIKFSNREGFSDFRVAISDLASLRELLARHNVSFKVEDSGVEISVSNAFGVNITFEETLKND